MDKERMAQQIIRGCSSKRCSQMQNKILYMKGRRPSGRRLSASPEVNSATPKDTQAIAYK